MSMRRAISACECPAASNRHTPPSHPRSSGRCSLAHCAAWAHLRAVLFPRGRLRCLPVRAGQGAQQIRLRARCLRFCSSPPNRIAHAFESLLDLPNLHFERKNDVLSALERYRVGYDFADALHHAAAVGCDAFATFDRDLIKRAKRRSLMPPIELARSLTPDVALHAAR